MASQRTTLIERLFAQHSGPLRSFFFRRIKRKQDVADLVQEVYLRMLRVKDGEAIKNPEGYLYAVANNLVYEHAMLHRRESTATDAELELFRTDAASPAGFEEFFDTKARVLRLQEVLAQLPPKCRAAVLLKYQHELSYVQIADHLNVSTHMVQKYLGTALVHCRRRMTRMR